MFVVNDDRSIYLTRGDTVFFRVTAKDHGTPYTFKPGDIVRMSVTAKKDVSTVYLQKDFPVYKATKSVFIYLEEKDTKIGKKANKHEDFWYEIVLNPDTRPQTVIGYDDDGPKIFRVFPDADEIDPAVPEPEEIPVVDAELDLTSNRPVSNHAVSVAIAKLTAAVEELKGAMPEEEPSAGSVFNAAGQVEGLSIVTIDAYGVAVRNGFEGTEQEWLDSLKASPGSGGISAEAAALLISILQEALYGSDQSGNIQKLAQMLQSGGSSPDFPDDPDEPDIPEVKKLATPVIRLVTEGDEPEEPDVPIDPGEKTPAILGVAILGRTILGDYDNDLPKLAKPQIQLVTLADDAPKLETPQIQLVTEDAPDEPNPPKLTAPEIYLETVTEPKDPETPKLEKPEIYLETITSIDPPDPGYSGPDEPEMEQLATPEIYLETLFPKLNTPSIELVRWVNARINGGYVEWDLVDGVSTYNVHLYENGVEIYKVAVSDSRFLLTRAGLTTGRTFTVVVKIGDEVVSNELTYMT